MWLINKMYNQQILYQPVLDKLIISQNLPTLKIFMKPVDVLRKLLEEELFVPSLQIDEIIDNLNENDVISMIRMILYELNFNNTD